jgi:hypothetical protein
MTAQSLYDKLSAAAERARLRYMVLMTITTTLRRGKVTPAMALEWLEGEGYADEIEIE